MKRAIAMFSAFFVAMSPFSAYASEIKGDLNMDGLEASGLDGEGLQMGESFGDSLQMGEISGDSFQEGGLQTGELSLSGAVSSGEGETSNMASGLSLSGDGLTDKSTSLPDGLSSSLDGDGSLADKSAAIMSNPYDAIFESMASGDNKTLSEAIGAVFQTQLSQNSMFNISDIEIPESFDMGALNLQYESAKEEMLRNTSLTTGDGSAMGCMDLFQNTYGDLSDGFELKPAEIPSDFNASSMLDSMKMTFGSAYAKEISSSKFQGAKSAISMSESIFKTAQTSLSMPSLPSASAMSKSLSGLSSKARSSIGKEATSKKQASKKVAKSFLSAASLGASTGGGAAKGGIVKQQKEIQKKAKETTGKKD